MPNDKYIKTKVKYLKDFRLTNQAMTDFLQSIYDDGFKDGYNNNFNGSPKKHHFCPNTGAELKHCPICHRA